MTTIAVPHDVIEAMTQSLNGSGKPRKMTNDLVLAAVQAANSMGWCLKNDPVALNVNASQEAVPQRSSSEAVRQLNEIASDILEGRNRE